MKCPKCQYISFETGERCRNCGYEFSLAVDAAGFDLPIQTGDEAIGPLIDFALEPHERSASAGVVVAGPPAAPLADFGPTPSRPITSSFDLPLFKERRREPDAPLVTPPAEPRPPLAVRAVRRSPPASRANRTADEPVLDLETALPAERPAFSQRPDATPRPSKDDRTDDIDSVTAGVGPRLLAAAVDALILGSIGLVVLYLTLKVCGLQLARVAVIPPVPFAAFLLLIAGGYLTLFTAAGGQTIGKMAAGIKVVANDAGQLRVPLGHSVVRAAAYLVSAAPAGLGFLPALFGDDRRAIHDRLAETRVVKA
jgi:uncharacterized RDD family membrane protein YckC